MDAFLNSSMPAVYIVLNYTYSKGIDIGQSVAKGLFRFVSLWREVRADMHGGERERGDSRNGSIQFSFRKILSPLQQFQRQ